MTPGPTSTTPSRAAAELSSLHELARCCGLETSFTDGCGTHRQASQHAIVATLQALGVAAETPDDVARVGEARHREEWARMLPPVSVAWDGCLVTDLRVREADRDERVRCRLTLEDGGVREWADRVESLPTDEVADVAGRRHAMKRLSAPSSLALPLGYHQLRVALGNRSAESVVIAARGRPSIVRVGVAVAVWVCSCPSTRCTRPRAGVSVTSRTWGGCWTGCARPGRAHSRCCRSWPPTTTAIPATRARIYR